MHTSNLTANSDNKLKITNSLLNMDAYNYKRLT